MLPSGAAWRSVGLTLLVILPVTSAHADPTPRRAVSLAQSLREARAFMGTMRDESRRDAARIHELYARRTPPYTDRAAVAHGLVLGNVVRLPADSRFNIAPRLTGDNPIGEMDLAFQSLYVSAHPGALGCLIHVAWRVGTPLVDVTSLVRHLDYQDALRRTNVNASTAFSAHTIGVAFDLSILHQSPAVRRQMRDVLRRMREDGDLLFVAEQRQLVFHVVPHPERLDFYEAVFHGMTAAPIPRFTWSSTATATSPLLAVRLPSSGFAKPIPLHAHLWVSGCVAGFAVIRALRTRR